MSSEINRSYFVQKIIAISFALSLHQLLVSGGIDLAFLIMIVQEFSQNQQKFRLDIAKGEYNWQKWKNIAESRDITIIKNFEERMVV